ncbi:hypothetical protein RHS04_06530, partial [Rhizoctonia solani]
RALDNTSQRPRERNGRFASFNSHTTSSLARGTRAVSQPTAPPNIQPPQAPTSRHTPLPGLHASSPSRSTKPSPLSILSSLPAESPVLVDEDLPSDLKDTLDQTWTNIRLGTPRSPKAKSPWQLKLKSISPEVKPAPTPPISPTGIAPPPLGYAATSAMAIHSSKAAAKVSAIKLLNMLGQFEDNSQPMKEAEYRHKFKYLTTDCTDKVKAELWYMNLAYKGPAFYWYHELIETEQGKELARKWSMLEPEVEKRWNTPAIDLKAFKKRTRNKWEACTFDIDPMLEGLWNPALGTKPHLEWATYHKALGLCVKTGNAERVANTLCILLAHIINLLLDTDQYNKDFNQLMTDLGNLSSSRLLHAYKTWVAVKAMSPTTRQRQSHQTLAPPPKKHVHFQAPPVPSTRGVSLPPQQLANPTTATMPICHQLAPLQRAFTRDQPPHTKPEPPELPPRACSTSREPSKRPAASRSTSARLQNRATEDTLEAQQVYQLQLADWLQRHPSGLAPLNNPPPLMPGTYKQTTKLCIKCTCGNHTALLCPSIESVSKVERSYRSRVLYWLKKAPAPTRVFNQYLLDVGAKEEELEAEALEHKQGNK